MPACHWHGQALVKLSTAVAEGTWVDSDINGSNFQLQWQKEHRLALCLKFGSIFNLQWQKEHRLALCLKFGSVFNLQWQKEHR